MNGMDLFALIGILALLAVAAWFFQDGLRGVLKTYRSKRSFKNSDAIWMFIGLVVFGVGIWLLAILFGLMSA